MSSKVKRVLSKTINDVLFENTLAEIISENDQINAIFNALDSKIKNPTQEKIQKLFVDMGVPFKFAKNIAAEYMSRKELDEMTNQAAIQGYNVPGAFSGKNSRQKKDDDDARIAHGTVSKQIHTKVDNLNEGKISVGDGVHVKKSAPVLDKKFIGKLGTVTGVHGNELTVKFPNGRSIILLPKDVDKAPETLDEVSYRDFKNDETRTSKQKIGDCIREINSALYNIERTIKRANKLKTETGVEPSQYWSSTHKRINKISERMLKVARVLREMK